jgi:hypothetical protein
LIDQYASAKAEGFFCTKDWQVGACALQAASVDHTFPAQSPQKVVSNTYNSWVRTKVQFEDDGSLQSAGS